MFIQNYNAQTNNYIKAPKDSAGEITEEKVSLFGTSYKTPGSQHQ